MKEKVLFDFGHLFKSDTYTDQGLAAGALKNLDRLDGIHKLAKERIEKITHGGTLTAQGRIEAFRDLAKEISENMEGTTRVLDGYRDQINRLENTMTPKRHRTDDLAWQLELREIRDHIRSLDPAAAEAFALSAISDGNEQVMEAIRHSPLPFRFANQQTLDRIDRVRVEREFPQETLQLADLRLAEQETRSALGSVRADLGKLGLVLRGQDLSSDEAA